MALLWPGRLRESQVRGSAGRWYGRECGCSGGCFNLTRWRPAGARERNDFGNVVSCVGNNALWL